MIQLFEHVETAPLDAITETYRDGKRWYQTPSGVYASLTTVLSWGKDEAPLRAWRERVGEVEAERISSESRETGTDMHSAIERFICGEPLYASSDRCRRLLRSMLPALARVDRVRHVEVPLFSDDLRVAGRCDCIAEFDGVLSIIDFKNSLRPKRREWIEDYFLQATGYACMYEERAGIPVPSGVILVATADGSLQVFTCNTKVLRPKLCSRVNRFYEEACHVQAAAATAD